MAGWGPMWDWIWLPVSPTHLAGTLLILLLLAIHVLAVDLAVRGMAAPKARRRLETERRRGL